MRGAIAIYLYQGFFTGGFVGKALHLRLIINKGGYKMLNPNRTSILAAVNAMNIISGYRPSIGEIAKVAGVSYGVAYRGLEFLVGKELINSHVTMEKRTAYRFSPAPKGLDALKEKGWQIYV